MKDKESTPVSSDSGGIQIQPVESEEERGGDAAISQTTAPISNKAAGDSESKESTPVSSDSGGIQIQPVESEEERGDAAISQTAAPISNKAAGDSESKESTPVSSDSGGIQIQPVNSNKEEKLTVSQKQKYRQMMYRLMIQRV